MRNCGPIRIIRENATEEGRSGGEKRCVFLCSREINLPIVRRRGTIGECFFFPKKQGWGREIGHCWRCSKMCYDVYYHVVEFQPKTPPMRGEIKK